MDTLSGVLEVRRWRQVGRVHSRPFHFGSGGRTWVLLEAELRRMTRRPGALGVWAALALSQYAVALVAPSVAGVARLLLAYVAANRLTGGLRMVAGSLGLRRALGGAETRVRLAHVAVPALVMALWWAVTWPADGGPYSGWNRYAVCVTGSTATVFARFTAVTVAFTVYLSGPS